MKIPLASMRVVQPAPVAAVSVQALVKHGFTLPEVEAMVVAGRIRWLPGFAAYEIVDASVADLGAVATDEVMSLVDLVRAAVPA